jgi:hypothetical protein
MGVVQGTSHPEHVVMDIESVAGLLPTGSVYAFLAEHRRELFPDEMFADLFPSSLGRPSVPGDVVASVLVLQALEHRSDREAAEALTFDLRWKAAVGWPIGQPAFHPTVLAWWRRRLAASKRPNRIFDAVREVVAATGVLAGRTRRVLDSTILTDAVATQDTVTQLIAAIRRVGREVPGAIEVIATHCRAHDYADPGKPQIAWDDEAARAALADRPAGGRRPGDLGRGPRRPARAQDRAPAHRRVQGPHRGRAGHRAELCVRADPGQRRRGRRCHRRHRAARRRSHPRRADPGARRCGLRHWRGAGIPRGRRAHRGDQALAAAPADPRRVSPSMRSPSTRPPAP